MTLVFILPVPTPLIPVSGSCVACGCTEEHACEGGCAWVDEGRLLCSSCLSRAAEARAFRTAAPMAVPTHALLVEAGGRLVAEILRLEDAAEEADEAGDEEAAADLRGMQERLGKVQELVQRALEQGPGG